MIYIKTLFNHRIIAHMHYYAVFTLLPCTHGRSSVTIRLAAASFHANVASLPLITFVSTTSAPFYYTIAPLSATQRTSTTIIHNMEEHHPNLNTMLSYTCMYCTLHNVLYIHKIHAPSIHTDDTRAMLLDLHMYFKHSEICVSFDAACTGS